MSNPTPEEVRASIVPKSDQINADDLLTGPITVTIAKVSKGDREQPINIELVECKGKAYRPCKSMRRVLIAAFSEDPKQWIGKQMTLYCDPDVMWAGVKVGGVRISHLSISEPKTFLLTQTRGKKAEVVIQPIPAGLSDEDKTLIEAFKVDIANADTLETLKAAGFILKEHSKAIQDAVRPAYVKRQKELSQ